MTNEEMRELDAWICEHLFGYVFTDSPDDFTATSEGQFYKHTTKGAQGWRVVASKAYKKQFAPAGKPYAHSWSNFQPTTDSKLALEVLKKCAEVYHEVICIYQCPTSNEWEVSANVFHGEGEGEPRDIIMTAPTLELTIALFAKELFRKETNE